MRDLAEIILALVKLCIGSVLAIHLAKLVNEAIRNA